jgi:hypothetical protein
VLLNFTDFKCSASRAHPGVSEKAPNQVPDKVPGKAPPVTQNRISAVAGSDWTQDGTNPNSQNKPLCANEKFYSFNFESIFRLSDP